MKFQTRLLQSIFLLAALLCGTSYAAAAPSQPHAIKLDPVLVQNVTQLLDDSLDQLAEKSGPTDTSYYDDGVWVYKNHENSWACGAGPGTAAAVLWRYDTLYPNAAGAADKAKVQWLHNVAVQTFDHEIQYHVNPDGSFDQPTRPDTYFFNVELAVSYLELKNSLDSATKQRWLRALTGAVEYLVRDDGLPNASMGGWKAAGWYTNGNIELGNSELCYLAWKATGDSKYKALFEQELAKTLNPDQTRWKGFGLHYIKAPSKADGSDGAGFLAESNGDTPGLDPDYLQLQLTVASRLYVESHDPRILRLVNLLANAALQRVDQTTWIYDATHGTRHSLKTPFSSCGLTVACWLGGRSDFAPLLPDQFAKAIKPEYYGNAVQSWGSPGITRGYGNDVAVWLQAAEVADGK